MNFNEMYKYTKKLHLLYIEDDDILRAETLEILEDFFQSVLVATNGKEGLEKYQDFHDQHGSYVDIIITDINMPIMNGIDMAEAIILLNPNQSIFVISAYNDAEYLMKLINLGIDKFLVKPIQSKHLIKALHEKAQTYYNQKLADDYHLKLASMTVDLTKELEQKVQELHNQTHHDAMTGLLNRIALIENIKLQEFSTLTLVDIDRLQFINDLYSVEVGNQIIIQVANLLKNFAQKHNCILFRTSGDEFALCHQDMEIENAFTFISELSQVTTNLNLYIEEIAQEINVDTTIGMGLQDKNILTHADIALKHAKNNQHPYVIYNKSLNSLEKMKDMVEWKSKIETAIKNHDIIPVFQPIVDAKGRILKYETLMRMRQNIEGEEKLISPYFFLETAIKTKLYPQLSKIMVAATLESLKTADHTLSVNLTYSDFKNPEIIDLLTKELSQNDIGHRLIFEIVESESIGDYNVLENFINKFRKFGVRIAIDDFGSGFSSFQHIVQTAPDYIKIDGSLIKDIDTDLSSLTIVKAIVQFSQELGIEVIAEYVHAEHILNILKSLGIREFQGFYFYEPNPELIEEKESIPA